MKPILPLRYRFARRIYYSGLDLQSSFEFETDETAPGAAHGQGLQAQGFHQDGFPQPSFSPAGI
jgi:hypothetical protein